MVFFFQERAEYPASVPVLVKCACRPVHSHTHGIVAVMLRIEFHDGVLCLSQTLKHVPDFLRSHDIFDVDKLVEPLLQQQQHPFNLPVCHCRRFAFASTALGCGIPQLHIDFELARELCDGIDLPLDGYSAHEWRESILVLFAALDVEQHLHFCFHALLFLIAILLILRLLNCMRIRQNGAIKTGWDKSAGNEDVSYMESPLY